MKLKEYSIVSLLKKTILPYLVIATCWWIGFNPGFFSVDSFAVLNMARESNLNSLWTAQWAIFIEIVTLGGSHPELATLFVALILGFSLAVFVKSISVKNHGQWVGLLLMVTPVVGAMGITLWHDIPMVAGYLLIISGLSRSFVSKKYAYSLILLGLTLSSFRHNGLPTILVFLLIMLFWKTDRKFVVHSLILTLLFLFSSITLNQYYSGNPSTDKATYFNWMRNDISCYVSNNEKTVFLSSVYGKDSNPSEWSSKSACKWFSDAKNLSNHSLLLESRVIPAWLKLFKMDPIFIIETHLKRHAYLNPLPVFGLPNIPFIHTTIELQNQGVAFTYPQITETLRPFPRIWNGLNFIFGYAGIWLLVTYILAWTKRNFRYLQIALVGTITSLGLFIFADIPDGRYMLFTLIAGQYILLYELFEPCKNLCVKLLGRIRGSL